MFRTHPGFPTAVFERHGTDVQCQAILLINLLQPSHPERGINLATFSIAVFGISLSENR